jgi:hypothetical protein
MAVLALQKRVLGMIAFSQFVSAGTLHSSIRFPEDNPDRGTCFSVLARLGH